MKSLSEQLLEKYVKPEIKESVQEEILNTASFDLVEEAIPSNSVGGETKRYLTQFTNNGNNRRPVGTTIPVLEAGVYKIREDMQGVYFEHTAIKSDGLIRFKDERYESLLSEAKKFWSMKEDFAKVGMHYQRGMILEGAPGGGKSCLLKLMMEDVISNGDIIFLSDSPRVLTEALKQFKEVENTRNVMVVIEEVDEIISYNQRAMSELLDGQDKVDGVLFVATTNHIERIHPKFLREGRFDLKITVGMPPKEGRIAYLKEKIGLVEAENIIEEIADATDGFSFAQLREYVISVYCYKKDPTQVVNRIKHGKGLDESFEDVQDDQICEDIYYYYFAQDPVRSTKQFASNRNMARKDLQNVAKDLATTLLTKFGVNAEVITLMPQEGMDENERVAAIKFELAKLKPDSSTMALLKKMLAGEEPMKPAETKKVQAEILDKLRYNLKHTLDGWGLNDVRAAIGMKNESMDEEGSLRKHLPYGYKSMSGVTWSNSQVDKYNDIQDQINAYIKKGQKPPENLLNASHNLVMAFNQKDKK